MAPDRGDTNIDVNDIETFCAEISLQPTEQYTPAQTQESIVPSHLSHDPKTNARISDPFQFGQRYLSEADDVFAYNAWDHVEPDAEYESYSQAQYEKQRAAPVSDFDKQKINSNPEKWWNLFYKQKTSTFFKDRKWLGQEFPVLKQVTAAGAGPKVVLEVGAGAGNTAFPIMRWNQNADLTLWAVDFSKTAVEVMREADDYGETVSMPDTEGSRRPKIGTMRAEVWDIAGRQLPDGLLDGSVDIIILIFIFSALSPDQWKQAIDNVYRLLKPGGQVLFRDYGRGDLAQVRFKSGRYLEENFYVRGDGTRVYFFDKDELRRLWSGSDIESKQSAFQIDNLDLDRRLIVNRQRRIKMYRCWIQGRFTKSLAR